ncbi:hypothetical protein HHL17_01280 [Chitinophaga sp. G-6-1-13]|uniref:Uncharacterized protein n=1 Tax=Chitinophaga fulva TaxID=2728842 RepID=A0A848GB11_9BACT|nr:hypothetical protein [Chitinophaga fulva]NML35815.1 hypothetical protein [Chitinophaga fulva]
MKKLIFVSVLSLLLGFTPFSNAHPVEATASLTAARTQDIWFEITYKTSGLYVMQGIISVNGIFRNFNYGGIIIQANIGDSYAAYDAFFQYSDSGTITSEAMFVQLH